jgi:hypothetical protein
MAVIQVTPLGYFIFYTYFYNHARRSRLEKLLYIELSRSSSGYLKPLLDPGGGFTSVPLIQVGPLRYFIHISITTPIVYALKNYYR